MVESRFAPCLASRPWDDLVLVMLLWASTSSPTHGRVVPSLRFRLGWITDRNEAVPWISPLACGSKQEKHPSLTCFPISLACLGVVLSFPQTRSRGSITLAQYFQIEPIKRVSLVGYTPLRSFSSCVWYTIGSELIFQDVLHFHNCAWRHL